MFSDIYKIIETPDGMCLEVEGKVIQREEGAIDDALIGGNASAEFQEDDVGGSSLTSGVDIVMNHKLQETGFTKDSYKNYIKDYVKQLKAHLEKTNPERVNTFMKGAQETVKKILGNFKNYQFYTGERMNPDGMVGLLDYREDGITPFMIFFKDGLIIEKC
ncbi:hypothetical protein XELAEV_18013263mg [Xenopus laevis]|nr:hypothetical protein XELAEV_18013263mg [Xenopus laevis]